MEPNLQKIKESVQSLLSSGADPKFSEDLNQHVSKLVSKWNTIVTDKTMTHNYDLKTALENNKNVSSKCSVLLY